MEVIDAHAFPAFLTSVLTQISFQSHRILFSHASAEVRRKKYRGKKFCLNWVSNSQLPGHDSNMLTTEPPGQSSEILKFVFGCIEKIVRKGENAGYKHFLLFPQCFQMAYKVMFKDRMGGKELVLKYS